MELKIGDRVAVRSYEEIRKIERELSIASDKFPNEYKKYCGAEGVIDNISGNAVYIEGIPDDGFFERELELLEETVAIPEIVDAGEINILWE